MTENTPTPLGDKVARRNYVVFCGVSALVLFLVVLFTAIVVSG